MKFSEIQLDEEILKKQRENLTKRVLFSLAALAMGAWGAAFLEFPTLKYPKAPGVALLTAAILACVFLFRLPSALFDRSWVGTVEKVGVKTVVASGGRGRPQQKQAFYMTIRKEDGGIYEYQNLETVGERPSETDEASGKLRKNGVGGGDGGDINGNWSRFGLAAPYAEGDTTLHLRGQRYFATLGKGEDSFAVCPFCGEIVIPERERCYRCGARVVK